MQVDLDLLAPPSVDLLASTSEDDLSIDTVTDMIGLVDQRPPPREAVASLTPVERAIVYDWAAREHLRASDNDDVDRRRRPACLGQAALLAEIRGLVESTVDDARVAARLREIVGAQDEGRAPGSRETAYGEGPGRESPGGEDPHGEAPRGPGGDPQGSEWVVEVRFVVGLPPGSEPPTPAREAVEAASLAIAGPLGRLRSEHEIQIRPLSAADAPPGRPGEQNGPCDEWLLGFATALARTAGLPGARSAAAGYVRRAADLVELTLDDAQRVGLSADLASVLRRSGVPSSRLGRALAPLRRSLSDLALRRLESALIAGGVRGESDLRSATPGALAEIRGVGPRAVAALARHHLLQAPTRGESDRPTSPHPRGPTRGSAGRRSGRRGGARATTR